MGQQVRMQIVKDNDDNKRPKELLLLTSVNVVRYVVLMPNAEYIGIPRRIEDETERAFENIAQNVCPGNMGLLLLELSLKVKVKSY